MFKFALLLLSVACLLDPATAGSSALEAKHFKIIRESLTICNTDEVPGVCWEEVQACVKVHETILKEIEFPELTKEEFDIVDIDSDGTVTEIEWNTHVAQKQ